MEASTVAAETMNSAERVCGPSMTDELWLHMDGAPLNSRPEDTSPVRIYRVKQDDVISFNDHLSSRETANNCSVVRRQPFPRLSSQEIGH